MELDLEESEHLEFYIHDEKHKVRTSDLPPSMSLLDYIRDRLQLKGTKAMCREGGCGVCVVAATLKHPVTKKSVTLAVNSCLVNIFSCSGWRVQTIEGLGRQGSLHEIQKSLAENNATQCGFCSPGMVMNMYALQQSGKATKAEIENSFGGNICRCTGYRPILAAMRAVASDKDSDDFEMLVPDIEDLKLCKKNGDAECSKNCTEPCGFGKAYLAAADDDTKWYKAFSVAEIQKIFRQFPNVSVKLVAGNTAQGVYKDFADAKVCVDINDVSELKSYTHNTNELIIGANMSLTEVMDMFKDVSGKDVGFKYCTKLVDHMDLVAHVPVRNIGTIAGNLMIKHRHNEFPSDIYLLLATVDARVNTVDTNQIKNTLTMEEFLHYDMNRQIIKSIVVKPHMNCTLETYKIMPRAQNAHAIMNAGFLFYLKDGIVSKCTITYGNINKNFIRARNTEKLLLNKNLFDESTIKSAFKMLESELQPTAAPPEPSPAFRKKLAISLFYKFILSIAPNVGPTFKSGGQKLKRQGLSKGTQEYPVAPDGAVIGKPVLKLEAYAQATGEAQYIPDMPDQPGQLHAAFVLAKAPAYSRVLEVDLTAAKAVKGFVAFLDASDIKGLNSILPPPTSDPLFVADKKVLYFNQPFGIVVAKDRKAAESAAKLVNIKYSKPEQTPVIYLRDLISAGKTELVESKKATRTGEDVKKDVKGKVDLTWQYHFHMETHTCLVVPRDGEQYDVFASTQFISFTQAICSFVTGVPINKFNMQTTRLGGAFGAKISRCNYAAAATALAATKLRKPVRLWMTLADNMDAIGKRNPVSVNYDAKVNDDGVLQDLNMEVCSDVGLHEFDIPNVMLLDAFKGLYINDIFSWNYSKGKTNNPPATWTRSPGSAEGAAIIESIMEQISYETGKDPFEVRIKNIDPSKHEVLWKMIPEFKEWMKYDELVAEVAEFNKQNKWVKKGVSVVPLCYQLFFEGTFSAIVNIHGMDGSVTICHGGIEMGQGANTKAAQVVAEMFNIPMERISVKTTTSLIGPNDFVSGGSITSESICWALQKCCRTLLARIKDVEGADWNTKILNAYQANIQLSAYENFNSTRGDDQKAYLIYALLGTVIELDALTGNHIVTKMFCYEDTGESMSPWIDVGQVEGAIMMGLGYYTTEEVTFDEAGKLLNNRTWTYKPPGAKDIPMELHIKFPTGVPNPLSPFKTKATGEPPLCLTIGVPFAIKRAIKEIQLEVGSKIGGKWQNIDGPCTVEHNYMACDTDYNKFTLK